MELEEYRRMAAVETSHWWYRQTRALLQQLLRSYLPTRDHFLDAGAGTGATGAWLAGYGRAVAVDMEPLALELYREGHAGVGLSLADITALPFASGAFDLTLCVTVLCHEAIADPADAVGELVRVTAPGGIVALMEPGVRRLRRAHDRETHTGRRFSRADLSNLLAAAGCSIERATGAYSFLVPPAIVKAAIERRRTASDLDRAAGGLGGTLALAARAERAFLRRWSLPTGLSVVAIGRRPLTGGS
jgi:SAM-dependent methyltransferase